MSDEKPPLSEKSLAASVLAHLSWAATEDPSERTRPAREKFDQRFLDQAGGDPRRAAHLRKAYFANLALKSAQARRRRAEGKATGA